MIASHLPLQALAMLRASGRPFASIAKRNVTSHILERRNHLELLLRTSPNLRSLTITDPEMCDADLQLLACWQKDRQTGSASLKSRPAGGLNTLRITDARSITDDGLRLLGTIRGLTSINLDLSKCHDISGVGLARIGHLTGMQELSLRGSHFRGDDLLPLRAMTQMKSLWLNELEADGLVLFSHLQPLIALEALDIHIAAQPGRLAPDDRLRFGALAGMKNLRELRFMGDTDGDGEAVMDADLMQIGALSQLTRLTTDAFGISHHALGHLGRLKNLEHLDLLEAYSSAPWTWLENLPRLKCLNLIDCGDNFDVAHLAPLKSVETLTSLKFSYDHQPFDASLFMHLPLSLEQLDLSGCQLTTGDLALLRLPALSTLNLNSGRDHGAGQEWIEGALMAVHAMPTLRTVDVSNCGFSGDVVASLRRSTGLTIIDDSRPA